ncbi:hypothetical protein FGO68_gene17730 [Halteria grandinella]|uniref:Secreted protein n=1 Tax=Halteria grandinella TaxID=5974 RepID=A0A8J8P5A9_HALGN|nr:hypothetical protein FGO68_gene17730 [Halteria grandinella]
MSILLSLRVCISFSLSCLLYCHQAIFFHSHHFHLPLRISSCVKLPTEGSGASSYTARMVCIVELILHNRNPMALLHRVLRCADSLPLPSPIVPHQQLPLPQLALMRFLFLYQKSNGSAIGSYS